jgi:hypothetical protein
MVGFGGINRPLAHSVAIIRIVDRAQTAVLVDYLVSAAWLRQIAIEVGCLGSQ